MRLLGLAVVGLGLGAALGSPASDAPDRDLDGVADPADLCPDEPGPSQAELERCRWTENPPADYAHGCPRPPCLEVRVSDGFQPQTATIYFPRHSGTYSVAAYRSTLDRLRLDPASRHAIRLTGHTDEDEPPTLAQARIQALRAHLLAIGIPERRLVEEVHAPGLPDEHGRRRRVELELVAEPCPGSPFILDPVYFARGANLSDARVDHPGTERTLEDWFCLAFEHPDRKLEIVAHASEDEPDPRATSQRRADELRAHLIARGIPASQLAARGAGVDPQPKARTPAERRAWQRNARIELGGPM